MGDVEDIPHTRNYIPGTKIVYVIPPEYGIYPYTAETIVFYNMTVGITVKHEIFAWTLFSRNSRMALIREN